MSPVFIYAIVRKLKSDLQKAKVVNGNPVKLEILCNYTNDTASGTITADTGAQATNKMKLSESEVFSSLVKNEVKKRLKFDTIDVVSMNIDLLAESISADIYYQLNGEKLFLKLEKI